jgi:hypothetical protein
LDGYQKAESKTKKQKHETRVNTGVEAVSFAELLRNSPSPVK